MQDVEAAADRVAWPATMLRLSQSCLAILPMQMPTPPPLPSHLHRHAPAVGILEHAGLEGQRRVQQAAVALGVAAGIGGATAVQVELGCVGR